ncbi:unnamed protein product, partial [Closterium sp. Naga37s-1]
VHQRSCQRGQWIGSRGQWIGSRGQSIGSRGKTVCAGRDEVAQASQRLIHRSRTEAPHYAAALAAALCSLQAATPGYSITRSLTEAPHYAAALADSLLVTSFLVNT